MRSTTYFASRGVPILKKGICGIAVICGLIMIGYAIAYEKWLYIGVLLTPFLIYVSIDKPFLFPFGAYVFLLPFDQLLSFEGVAGGATLTKFLGILSIVVLFLKGFFENKLQKPDAVILLWLSLVLYGTLSLLWAIQPSLVTARISTAAGLLLLYVAASAYRIQEEEIRTLKSCILAGGVLAAMLTIYNFRSLELVARATVQVGDRAALLNQLPFDLLMPLAICIENFLDEKKMPIKVILGVMLGIIFFSIIITGSRGALVGSGAVIIVYVLCTRRRLSLGTLLLIVAITLLTATPAFFFERLGEAMETGGSGRMIIWTNGLLALKSYWLTGAGLNNFAEAYREAAYFTPLSSGIGRASHNIYLGIFVELGIVGFVLMIWGIWTHHRALRPKFVRPDSHRVMLKAALWGMLVASFFLDTFWYKSFWLLWMMIIMYKKVSAKSTGDMAGLYARPR